MRQWADLNTAQLSGKPQTNAHAKSRSKMAGNPRGVRNCATKVFVMWVNAFSHWNGTSAGTHLHAQRTLSITPAGEHTRSAWKQLRLPFFFCFFQIVDYGGLLRPLSLHWQLSDLATESRSFTNYCVSLRPTATISTHSRFLWMNHHPFTTNAHQSKPFSQKK